MRNKNKINDDYEFSISSSTIDKEEVIDEKNEIHENSNNSDTDERDIDFWL